MSTIYILTFGLFLASTSYAAEYGVVAGRTVKQGLDEPIEYILVSIDAPENYGRLPTDNTGHYQLDEVPPGTWDISFHCPSVSYVGREIHTQNVIVEEGQTTNLSIEVPDSYCYEPAYSERTMVFQGYLSFGFEESNFSPCNVETLDLTRNTFFNQNYIWTNISNLKDYAFKPDTLYFGIIEGMLKGPGQFGHLGVSNYELDVVSAREVTEVDKQDCAAHIQ